MYSMVLAAMLMAGPADAPAWGGCWGCHGCCGGCYGCCGGCYGCWGCHGCYGCCGGCYGCWGCSGCYGCYGCCGGCYGCCGGCYGCWGCSGCYGCYGGVVAYPAYYVASAPAPAPDVKVAAANQATVIVQLPADARLYVDGQKADLTSAKRSFITPALEAGREYYYTIKAETDRDGGTLSQSRRVIVRAGQVARVDFGDLTGPAVTDADSAPAHVTVRLPENARLFVDDVACPQKSRTPSFDTPKLDAGKTYAYTLRVDVDRDGVTHSLTRRVELRAGKRVNVDFTERGSVASR